MYLSHYWVYVARPFIGVFLAVAVSYLLRGSGGGKYGSTAAQGDLGTVMKNPVPPQRGPRP